MIVETIIKASLNMSRCHFQSVETISTCQDKLSQMSRIKSLDRDHVEAYRYPQAYMKTYTTHGKFPLKIYFTCKLPTILNIFFQIYF